MLLTAQKLHQRLIAKVKEVLEDLALHHLAPWPRPATGLTGVISRPTGSGRVHQTGGDKSSEKPNRSAGERGHVGESYHRPIMGAEVTHFLQPKPGQLILDGTLGGGGHTELILKTGANVLATDRDPVAIARALQRLEPLYPGKFAAIQSNFADFPDVLDTAGITHLLDGITLDLGLSSRQLENPERGFSFMREGALDMRFDPNAPITAADIVNGWSEEELLRILRVYGEEPNAKRIVRAILARRAQTPISTTTDLAAVVASVVPQKGRTHPATRTFQALRLEVNQELASLERALAVIPKWLRPGGRLVVLTFHSLEDRIVKHFLREHSQPEIDRPEWPCARPNPNYEFNLVIRKAVEASPEEVASNPRARSCKLRVAEKISPVVKS